jgi:hypothetical protein
MSRSAVDGRRSALVNSKPAQRWAFQHPVSVWSDIPALSVVTFCYRRACCRSQTTMILYKPGTQFMFKGRLVSVDYVIIRRTGMWVRLVDSEETCRPEELIPIVPHASGHTEGTGRR